MCCHLRSVYGGGTSPPRLLMWSVFSNGERLSTGAKMLDSLVARCE